VVQLSKAGIFFVCFLLGLGIVAGVSAASGIQTAMGDVVTLSGYSPSSPFVYLFLTGPNLPVNGVALDNINRRADQGGFTVVEVDGLTDRWTYKWNTGSTGGRLDAGAYMIWVANGPNDRSHLSQAEYSTITVNLGSPTISVDTPSVPATLEVTTEPAGVSVVLNEKYLGTTPITVSDLTPGTYTLSLSKFGYSRIITPVRLEAGKITSVDAPLAPQAGALAVNTSPAGATLQLDGSPAGISPALLSNLTTGSHLLQVSHEGYVSSQEQVTVTADQVVPVMVNLSEVTPTGTLPRQSAGFFLLPVCATGLAVLLGIWYRRRSD
jgi:hypothetical protein